MRRPVLPLLFLAVVVLVAVGTCNARDDGGDRSRVRAAEPPTPRLQLEDALLDLGDLPEGYVEAGLEDDDLPRTYYEVCGDPDVYGGLKPDLTAAARFQDRGGDRLVSHDLRRHPDGTAAEAFRRLEDALARCDSVTEHDRTGATTRNTLTLVEPPAVPDPAVRFRLSRSEGGNRWHADVVVVRRGDVLSMLAVYGTGTGEPRLVDLAERVDERLVRVT